MTDDHDPEVTVARLPEVADAPTPEDEDAEPEGAAAWTGQIGIPTRLLLLRHGQTALSIQHRYSGLGDPELTALGHDQAAGAAARLAAPEAGGLAPDGIAAVLTSPLRRARQTAAAVADALGVPMEERDGLVETDFGGWEGLTFAEARERDPELHAAWLGDEHAAPPGGESFATVGVRRRRRARLDRRGVPGADRGGRQPRHADQAAAPAGPGRRPGDPLPAAPGPGVALGGRLLPRTAARRCGCSTTRPTSRAPDAFAARTPIAVAQTVTVALCAVRRLARCATRRRRAPLRNGPGRRTPAPRGRRRPR